MIGGYPLIASGVSLVIGVLMSILILLLIREFYIILRISKAGDTKLIFYAFIFFLLSSLSLILFNSTSMLFLFLDDRISGLVMHQMGILAYNMLLSIGLFNPIYFEIREIRTSYKLEEVPLAIIAISMSVEISSYLSIICKVFMWVVSLEAILLLYFYIARVRSGRLISGSLWMASLALLLIGRLLNTLEIIPLSEFFTLYMDLFAYTSLFLLQQEIKIKIGGSEV